jgi:hypothetical protein
MEEIGFILFNLGIGVGSYLLMKLIGLIPDIGMKVKDDEYV